MASLTLPRPRRRNLEQFLASIGVLEHDITAMHKMLWLEMQLRRHPTPSYRMFRKLGQMLQGLGPLDELEQRRQAELVRAFTLEFRNSRLVRPTNTAPPMPLAVFRRVLHELQSSDTGTLCARAALVIAWHTGAMPENLIALRWEWIRHTDDGMVLSLCNRARKMYTVPVREIADSDMCAVKAVREWAARSDAPVDSPAYVFPAWYWRKCVRSWTKQTHCQSFSKLLFKTLKSIGENDKGYSFISIRRAFVLRCRNNFGAVATTALAGYSDPRSAGLLLRSEPEWNQVTSELFDNMKS
ncbi:MAG: hypothetical protein GIW98_06450 [Candidatus Eremiobacteraeota bacterium]|nr:hypothetical protein [Candidatus Eremiobacteraeota bacterium]